MGLQHLVCLKKPVGCNSVMHNSCFFIPFMFPKTDSEPNPAPMWQIMERLQQCFICEQMCLYFRCPFQGRDWVNRGKMANSIILIENRKSNRGHRVNEYWGAWEMFSIHPVNVSASLQLPYKELPVNTNRIPALPLSSGLYHNSWRSCLSQCLQALLLFQIQDAGTHNWFSLGKWPF